MMTRLLVMLLVVGLSGCTLTKHSDEQSDVISPERMHTMSSGGPLSQAQSAFELAHADLSFTLYPQTQSLAGIARLTLKTRAQSERIVIDLDSLFTIENVSLNGVEVKRPSYRHVNGQLSIALRGKTTLGSEQLLTIVYSGAPHVAKNPPWQGGIIWQKTPQGQPWIATAVQSEGCDLFWPCIDNPLREPQSLDIRITVPANLSAVSNGRLISDETQGDWRTFHWRSERPVNTYAVSLNVGPFELLSGKYQSRYGNTIDLMYWHLPSNGEKAQGLFDEFAPMLDFFEAMIGPYPFYDDKMGVVETPHLGMEHQTINAYGNGYKVGYYGYDWLLHHEFSHEWFGNQLTHKNQDDIWLHEGLGTYMQGLYAQYLQGDLAYHAFLYRQRHAIRNDGAMVHAKPRTENDLQADGSGQDAYYKGALFLHTLRALIGDKAFFATIRAVVYGTTDPKPGNFAPRFAATDDFIAAAEQQSGQDLGWLFKVYLYQAKLPELVATRQGDSIEYRWQTQDDVPFPMPLEVSIDGEVVTLAMSNGKGVVKASKKAVVIPDPNSKVLRHQPHFDKWRKTGRKHRDN